MLLVFDLDGTLVDTNRDLIPALNHAIRDERVEPIGVEEVGHVVGQGARAMIERAFALRGRVVPAARMDALHGAFLAHYEAHIADLSRPYPALLDAMDALEAENWRFAVCTNKSERLATLLLGTLGLLDRFAAVTGGDTFPERKPDPAHVLGTIERADGDPKRSIMVGDSINDILAAQRAGVASIVVDFGYSDRPVETLGADRLISRYDDLPTAARALAAQAA